MRYISKRAFMMDSMKSMFSSLIRPDQGKAENLLRLASYAPSAFGLSGMLVTGIDKVLSMYGWGLEDLGRLLDKSGVTDQVFGMFGFAKTREEGFQKIAAMNEDIIKEALIGAGLKAIWKLIKIIPGGIKGIASILWTVAKGLMLAFGFTKIGQLWDAMQGKTDPFAVQEHLQLELPQGRSEDPSLNPEHYGPRGYMGPRS